MIILFFFSANTFIEKTLSTDTVMNHESWVFLHHKHFTRQNSVHARWAWAAAVLNRSNTVCKYRKTRGYANECKWIKCTWKGYFASVCAAWLDLNSQGFFSFQFLTVLCIYITFGINILTVQKKVLNIKMLIEIYKWFISCLQCSVSRLNFYHYNNWGLLYSTPISLCDT